MAEPYTCAASPYWAAKGLLALSLGPNHAFFAAPEQQYPAEKSLRNSTPSELEAASTLKTPGWVIRHRRGEVTLVNAGGSSSMSAMKRFGAWKWGKLLYSTGVGGLQTSSSQGEPIDNGLTARLHDSREFVGRHNTIPVRVSDDRIICQYQIGAPYSSMNVSVCTHLWFVHDWYIALHTGRAHQPTELRAGAFAIACPQHSAVHGLEAVTYNDEFSTRIMNLLGFSQASIETSDQRQHLLATEHAVPHLTTETVEGNYRIACAWSLTEPQATSTLILEEMSSDAAKISIDGQSCLLESPHWAEI